MSLSFSANQYDSSFNPKKLRNWEVARETSIYPCFRKNATKVIADNNGHILKSIPRPKSSPWGNFKNTWQLPNKITKYEAGKINRELIGQQRKVNEVKDKHKNLPEKDLQFSQKFISPTSNISSNIEYKQKTCDISNPEHDYINNSKVNNDSFVTKTITSSNLNNLDKKEIEITQEIKTMENSNSFNEHSLTITHPAYLNFLTAKKMAQENLEHKPLPDCISDENYRRLQLQKSINPGIVLDIIPSVSGIGVKTYKAGPTQCTKMKIYRPKTCGVVPKPVDTSDLNNRPQTSIIKKENLSLMDLAICWDYHPQNKNNEPKPSKHIDGSNGSAAPSVFTLVKTPRISKINELNHIGGVCNNTLGETNFFEKDIIQRKTSFTQKYQNYTKCSCGTSPIDFQISGKQLEHSISSPNSSTSKIITKDIITTAKCNETNEKSNKNIAQDCFKNFFPKFNSKKSNKLTSENKTSSKLDLLKSNQFTSSDNGCNTISLTMLPKKQHIPKPRNPYTKKNYDINTLVPPFTCYKGGAGQGGYPEFWRLSSVYQHAYKPIEQRRKPLLQTVYK